MTPIQSCILKKNKNVCPIWIMRQAGRYLPEFRKIRSNNKDFIKLCLNKKLIPEITLQPLQRFDLDAAIIFSDILMIPHGLGQNVTFTKDLGPQLDLINQEILSKIHKEDFEKKLSPIYKAIDITRRKLIKSKSLISFIGAPWSLIVYMLNVKESKKEINLKKLQDKKKYLNQIIETLIYFLCIHIKNQINAGADVIQIFDSWAGLIPEENLNDYCYTPNLKISNFFKKQKIPVICFPKGIKENYEDFNKIVKSDGINLDPEINPVWAREKLKNVVIQGGLNPNILL